MNHYIALIHRDAGSDYGVSCPDLPGCITAGATLEEARAFADQALALHLAGMAADKEAPQSRSRSPPSCRPARWASASTTLSVEIVGLAYSQQAGRAGA